MKTVPYTYVLQQACELTGRVYPPTTEEASAFGTFIGMALRQAWEAFDWPEVKIVSQEFFAADYDPTATYTAGQVVYYPTETKYYQCVKDGTTNLPPTVNGPNGELYSINWALAQPVYTATNGTYTDTGSYTLGNIVLWPEDQNFYQCIDYTASGIDPSVSTVWGVLNPFIRKINLRTNPDGTVRDQIIGEVFSVYQANPEITWRQRLLGFSFDEDGLVIGDQIPSVWLEWRVEPTSFTSGPPEVIPYRFQQIVALRAAGQMLKVDGKMDLGNEMLVLGESALADEVDKVARQEMQTRQVVFSGR